LIEGRRRQVSSGKLASASRRSPRLAESSGQILRIAKVARLGVKCGDGRGRRGQLPRAVAPSNSIRSFIRSLPRGRRRDVRAAPPAITVGNFCCTHMPLFGRRLRQGRRLARHRRQYIRPRLAHRGEQRAGHHCESDQEAGDSAEITEKAGDETHRRQRNVAPHPRRQRALVLLVPDYLAAKACADF
jgi:hypothetical protein